ncbi:MAG: hypothetical protein R2757_00685 [Draconibacterium sp.]
MNYKLGNMKDAINYLNKSSKGYEQLFKLTNNEEYKENAILYEKYVDRLKKI